MTSIPLRLHRLQLTLLGAACAVALPCVAGASAPSRPNTAGATLVVSNCNDSGAGSLRAAVADANSGDTLDLTRAGCGRIKLAGQPIAIAQNDLNIVGPGRYQMVLDGDYKSSVLRHAGTGTLSITGVSVEHGQHKVYAGNGFADGGCIYTAGSLRLESSEVRHCGVYGRSLGSGGGIFAAGDVNVLQSSIFSNGTHYSASGNGGGIFALGRITLRHSRIIGNLSIYGGGIYTQGGVTIFDSVLANNTATNSGGAMEVDTNDSVSTIANSTISGNHALNVGGGVENSTVLTIVNSTLSGNTAPLYPALFTNSNSITVNNSTIAYNDVVGNDIHHPDVPCSKNSAFYSSPLVRVNSSIFANNTCDGKPGMDVGVGSESGVIGANNLVMRADDGTVLPADTIVADPLLLPLADNGGVRFTHALQAGSPAIDRGNDAAGIFWDQRGVGFPRTKGSSTDIGAYEY